MLERLSASFSFVGLVVATFFFAESLTPSLLPRNFAVQGVLSGVALAVVNSWLGHSPKIEERHYLQVTNDRFAAASALPESAPTAQLGPKS
jgi:uncharacterized membrane protein